MAQKAKAERLKAKILREEHLRQEVRVAKQAAKEHVAEEDLEDYRKRRALQIAEAEVNFNFTASIFFMFCKLCTWFVFRPSKPQSLLNK